MDNQNGNFFSMDRLVEFGMGMAMSQQIARSMNEMMAQMRTPPQVQVAAQPLYAMPPIRQGVPVAPVLRQGAAQAPSSSPAAAANAGAQSAPPPPPLPMIPEAYYVAIDGRQDGPYGGTEIARLVLEKKVTARTMAWKAGTEGWKPTGEFPELLCLISLAPPELKQEEEGGAE